MRTKKTNKKLSLNKVTVSCLSENVLCRVNAGAIEVKALRTRYTACNEEAQRAFVITGVSKVDNCVSAVIVCVKG